VTITEKYRALNAQLHRELPKFGANGRIWAPRIEELARDVGAESILDYGCGKGSLAKALQAFDVREYDPAIPGKDRAPVPADLVVCTDVLEHVEPDCLESVINHLGGLATKALFVNVSLRKGTKRLPDGRLAHLIVKPKDWWRKKLSVLGTWREVYHEELSLNAICVREP
jgi:hypothetical protein